MSSTQNPLISKLIIPIDGTAAAPSIAIGGGINGPSGTGIYGNELELDIAVGGVKVVSVTSSGISATIAGPVANLAGGSGGTIPYQSAANTTAMLANGTAGQVLASQGTTVAPHYITLPVQLAFSSSAGAGGTATEVMVVTGLLATDTILAVSQKTPGANSLPLLGFSTQANAALTAIWSADPGAGSVILVSVKR